MKSKHDAVDKDVSKNELGFTLIELMMAMVVCVVAMLTIVGAMTAIKQATEKAYEKSIVTQDIHEVIEEMRDAANATSSDDYQSNVVSAASDAAVIMVSLPASFEQSIDVSYEDPAADPLDVTVTASWLQQGIRPTSLSMRALITRRT